MSERRIQLFDTADGQISELIGLFSKSGEAALSLRCPGREKLGDGTVAALALHTADSYLRIAGFLQATSRMPPAQPRSRRPPRLFRARGHSPPGHAEGGQDARRRDDDYTAENVPDLLKRLSTGREALRLMTELTDEQLDTAPPTGSFRFCDGQRTLEQVLASLLNHQGHQVDAMRAAVT